MGAKDKIPPGQLKKILAFNKEVKDAKERGDAGKVLADAIASLPPGQQKHFLTDEVKAALEKFGIKLE